jgi:hypothetical protein
MGKNNIVVYGKIQLSSDSEGLAELVDMLKKILNEIGYPDRRSPEDMKKEEDDLKKELEELDKNGAKDVVPLNRAKSGDLDGGQVQGIPEEEDAM